MENVSIHPQTRLGSVHLTVTGLERSIHFYESSLGFRLRRVEANTAYLGAGGADLLALTENRNARPARDATGLYHFAVLVPSREELAQSLRRIAETETPVQGFSDHFVSEAIYLADPDGNGIEIYRDRPREQWRDAQGNFHMTTDPLDIQGLMSELRGESEAWKGLDPRTTLGHMHLQVANVAAAEKFYVGVLGFDLMMGMGSAGFVSAGGYHHHIAFNIWNSRGAPPPPPDAVGLRHFSIVLPDERELARVSDRVRRAGIALDETDQGLFVRDPSQNGIVFTVEKEKQGAPELAPSLKIPTK